MTEIKFEKTILAGIPCIIYGEQTQKVFLFVHGKQGSKQDAELLAQVVVPEQYQVISFDLPEHGDRKEEHYSLTIQNAVHDIGKIYNWVSLHYSAISLCAYSLGAYFSLSAFQKHKFDICLFLSPILAMETLIKNMMLDAHITEMQLEREQIIPLNYGETLSWDYLQYVRQNPIIAWDSPTYMLFGEHDHLTDRKSIEEFIARIPCTIDIMKNGEHFFHTPAHIRYVTEWIRNKIALQL